MNQIEKEKPLIRLCHGSSCKVNGAARIEKAIFSQLAISEIEEKSCFILKRSTCMGSCDLAPAIEVDGEVFGELTQEKIKDLFADLQGK